MLKITSDNSTVTGQLWSISTTTFQVRLRIQLNTILFAKTLVRKDVASSAATASKDKDKDKNADSSSAASSPTTPNNDSEDKDGSSEFSSKAQVMTLMTTDVDRVSEFAWHLFSLIDAPIEIVIGSFFLYQLLGKSGGSAPHGHLIMIVSGVSCFIGLAVTCLFLPMNHFAGKIVVKAQDNLMSARDERVALMNEVACLLSFVYIRD
jgi:hypothetical protein